MAHFDIFRHHIAIKFPAYGHALWDPDPGNLYPAVEVGDVGYICEGKFHRLFNALLPEDHPSHRNFGVPEHHEQLTLDIKDHINICKLSPNNFCSAKVTSRPVSEMLATGPDEIPQVSFSCPMKEGAVLCLPVQAKGVNTVAKTKFGKWITSHIDRWFAWALQLELGVERMEDIILVTGTHRTRSWTNVAFPGGQEGAQASFGAKAEHRGDVVAINWQFSQEQNQGAVLNCGPDGENLPEDQCIFIRGFRAARRFKILPRRLKGAAGPNPDPEGDEGSDTELIPIPAVPEYRDPLHILLEYVADAAPSHCNMALVHDDDLERLDGIFDSTELLDTLRPDVVLNHIRSLKPTIYYTDLSFARNSSSPSTWVATISNVFEQQVPPGPSTSSASRGRISSNIYLPFKGGGSTGLECFRCGKSGHNALECPEEPTRGSLYSGYGHGSVGYRSFGGGKNEQTCHTCGGVGHLSHDCGQGPNCSNCSSIGHISRDCPQPQRRACNACGSEGHIILDCPVVRDTSDTPVNAGRRSSSSHYQQARVDYSSPQRSFSHQSYSSSQSYGPPTPPILPLDYTPVSVDASFGSQKKCIIPDCHNPVYYNVAEEELMEYCGHGHELQAIETGFVKPCAMCKARPRRTNERVCGPVCRERERNAHAIQGSYYGVSVTRREPTTR